MKPVINNIRKKMFFFVMKTNWDFPLPEALTLG